jgi:hypothetical protein
VLEDDARVDEVESPTSNWARSSAALITNSQVGTSSLRRVACDHCLRDVDAHGPPEPRSERAREAPEATTEVERTSARDRTKPVSDLEDVRDLRVAGCEEALGIPRAALLLRRGEHGPHRIRLGEALPVLLVPFQAHSPTIH